NAKNAIVGAFFLSGMAGSLETKKAPNSGRWWLYSGNKKAPFLALVWLLAEAGGDVVKQIIFNKLEFSHAKFRFSAIFDRFHDSQIAE
ncbi:hypothetical protein NL370_27495, partial [Klebsiella pneumoniae]|nr:hypothetical protein [Klebsiella pneumoniae]